MKSQKEKAEQLLNLHRGPKILVLPNSWDVASARVFEESGFPVTATSSAGVANSLGYSDGQLISRDEMIDVVRRIARAVSGPVTADMEAGYGETADAVVETVKELIDAGAVGMNFEDATGNDSRPLFDMAEQVEKIKKIKEYTKSRGIPFVLNARTDVFLLQIGPESERLEHTITRLNAYHAAGADCLFAPAADSPDVISRLVKGLTGPLNILGRAGVPSIPELEKLGVTRVSIGSGPMRAAMGLVKNIAGELIETGTYKKFSEGAISYSELNAIMDKSPK